MEFGFDLQRAAHGGDALADAGEPQAAPESGGELGRDVEPTPVVVNGAPTLFDHDADGVRTGTGWLRPDDGWLALDRNGNGNIDSGRELFGVDTLITTTQVVNGQSQTTTRNAANGFEALASLDTGNGSAGSAGFGDRIFNASDAQFANLRIWRDLNGDGISQAGELQSLAAAGIASIALNFNSTNTNLGNGNTLTGTASVKRSNGSSTTAGSVLIQAGNLNLANQSAVERRPLRFAQRVSGRTTRGLRASQDSRCPGTTSRMARLCGGSHRPRPHVRRAWQVVGELGGCPPFATLRLEWAAIDVDGIAVRLSPGVSATGEIRTGGGAGD